MRTTTKYYPQANRLVKRFNVTMILIMRLYVIKIPKVWATSVFPLMYAYNVQVHRTTIPPPFTLAINRLRQRLTAIARLMPPDVGVLDSILACTLFIIHEDDVLRKMADMNSNQAQARHRKDYNKHFRFKATLCSGRPQIQRTPSITGSCCLQTMFEATVQSNRT